jgi:DNA-binding MarR family transcriptional regulator
MSTPNLDSLPDALSTHVGYLLVRLGKHSQRLFSLSIEPLGLRPPHCDILFLLAARGAFSQTGIASALAIEPAHLVALLDQLEKLGLVVRGPDAADRRRHAVRLTKQGGRTAAQVSNIALKVEDVLLDGLDSTERDALRRVLRRLARDAEEGD